MTPRRLVDRRQRRRQKLAFWGLVGLFVAYLLLIGDHRPHHLALLWLEEQRTHEDMARSKAENDSLRERRRRLEKNAFALESLARDKGMVRPGDVVYRIVPVPPGFRTTPADSAASARAGAAADSTGVP